MRLRARWSEALSRAKGWVPPPPRRSESRRTRMNRDEMRARARAPRARAVGLHHHRRRSDGRRRRGRCRVTRLQRRCCSSRATSARAPRAAARSLCTAAYAISSRQHLARHGSAQGARHPAAERAAPGQRPAVRRADYAWWEAPSTASGLKLYDLLAGKYGFGQSRSSRGRDAATPADHQHGWTSRRRRCTTTGSSTMRGC